MLFHLFLVQPGAELDGSVPLLVPLGNRQNLINLRDHFRLDPDIPDHINLFLGDFGARFHVAQQLAAEKDAARASVTEEKSRGETEHLLADDGVLALATVHAR